MRWIEGIERRCRLLGGAPGLGAARPEIRPDLRLMPVGRYLILYREVPDGAEIVRVLHGARDWPSLIGDDPG